MKIAAPFHPVRFDEIEDKISISGPKGSVESIFSETDTTSTVGHNAKMRSCERCVGVAECCVAEAQVRPGVGGATFVGVY